MAGLAVLSTVSAQSGTQSTTNEDAKQLALISQKFEKETKAYKLHPTISHRKSLVIATVRYGTAVMMAPSLSPKVKYPKALRLYRAALKLDPNNYEASNNADMIISIYNQMHRPIPK